MNESKTEEILASLKLIAGLLAWIAGIRWLAWVCFVNCAWDILCAFGYAILDKCSRS